MSEDTSDMVCPSCGGVYSLNVWRCVCVFLASLLMPGFVFAACVHIDVNVAKPLLGTPFSTCSISGSTVTCNQDLTIAKSSSNICITTNASPLTVNMSGKTFNWLGNGGQLGSDGHPINLVMGAGTINLEGSNFTSYGDWSGNKIQCLTSLSATLKGTLTATSTNTCAQYVVAEPEPVPLADWHMDESTPYTGAVGEVKNSVFWGANGRAVNGANNGSGKVCRAATFDGTNDYISVTGLSSQLSGTASISFWINTKQSGGTSSWTSPGVTGVEQGGGGNDIFWGWINPTGKIAVNKGNTLGAQSISSINNGAWRHIVLTRDQATGATKAYIDGVLESARNSELGLVTTPFASIGAMERAKNLSGSLDEVKVFATVLSNAQVASIYANEVAGNNWDGSARACPVSGPHHLEIVHPNGTGLTCTASTLTVRACADAACAALYTGGVSGTLTVTGTPIVNWDGTTGGSAGASFVIPAGSSSVTKNVQVASAGAVVFGISAPTPAPTNATACNFGSPSCTFTAKTGGFIFSNTATGTAYTVPAQVAGIPSSNLYLRALETSTSNPAVCTPAIIGQTTSVNLGYACNNPSTCQPGSLATVNSTAVAPAGTAVNLTFDGNGSAPVTLRYDDVGQITFNASKTITPFVGSTPVTLTGNSNAVVVAPHHFGFSSITAGLIKAGNNFSATVTAYNGLSVPTATPNFGKEATPEQVTISRVRYKPSASVAGTSDGLFSGAVGAFSLGAATASNLNWSEVGIIDLSATLTSGSYLASGLTAVGSTGTTGAVGSNGLVVRFIPDHFDTVVSLTAGVPMPCPAGLTCPSQYNGFAYSDQGVPLTVTAKNGLSTPSTTVNYNYSATASESFSKAVTLSAVATVGGAAIATTAPGGVVSAAAVPATSFTAGTTPTLAFPVFTFAATSTAPINVFWRASDTDSVTSLRSIPSNSVEGGVKVVSGRLKIANAYGSELLPLPLKVAAQFYNGTGWVTSTTDSLSLPGGTVGTSAVTGATLCAVAGFESTPPALALGIGSLTLTKPSNGRCSADITLSAPSFLPSVSGRATFGVYKSPLIYRRENY
jgi:MSHA biogenesis protein MshQ